MGYSTTISKTPLLIFDGNCQAHHLSAIFEGAGLAESYCTGEDYGFVPSYQGSTTVYCSVDEATNLVRRAKEDGRHVYQVSQSTQMQAFAKAAYTEFVDAVIKFPYLQCYSVAPSAFEAVYKRRPPLKKILDFDLSLMKLCQEKAESDVDFVSFVRDSGVDQMLFNTESHPRGPLVAKLFSLVGRQIPVLNGRDVDEVAIDLERSEGINHVTIHPIAGDILQELGFHWGPDYLHLSKVLRAAGEGKWQTVVELCDDSALTFVDSQLLLALGRANMELGRLEGQGAVYAALTRLSPGFLHSWLLRASYWRQMGDAVEVRRCHIEMRRALGSRRYYSHVRSWMDIQEGHFDSALGFAFDYLERTPDRADGVVPYAKALSLLGRMDEGRDVFFTFARNRGPADFPYIEQQLPSLEELNIDKAALHAHVHAT